VTPGKNPNTELSPEFGELSPFLIAKFYAIRRNNNGSWLAVEGEPIVKCAFTDCNLDATMQWESPFEGGGSTPFQATGAMLKSGEAARRADAAGLPNNFFSNFEGRAGITKLNSTQVFNGMPPVKITVTALFSAWADAEKEVERPFNKLMEWALPQYLAPDRITGLQKAKNTAEAIFPSKAPTIIALNYQGKSYSPLVIESISVPLDSPIDRRGYHTSLSISMTLCTLTALDKYDWQTTYTGGQPIGVKNFA
jgi:hypothetical protein